MTDVENQESAHRVGRTLANRLRRTLTGPMWHGPAIMELLRSVDATQAAQRPVNNAHSIWELVLHMTTWARIARQRIDGQSLEYSDSGVDWPSQPDDLATERWNESLQRLSDAYEALAVTARDIDDKAMRNRVGSEKYSVETMICGVIEHGAYHGGQIAILLKAGTSPT